MSESKAKQARRELRALEQAGVPAANGDELELKVPSGFEYDVRPLAGYVLCRKVAQNERTAGGLIIPEKAREAKLPRFEVLAVGPGLFPPAGNERVPQQVQVGDQVLVAPQLGSVLELPDHEQTTAVVHENAIFAVVKVKAPALESLDF